MSVSPSSTIAALAQERPKLAEQLRTLPDRPGVYLFKDAKGRLLYVGKAESLKDRVRSYFQPSTSFDQQHQPKLRSMTMLAQSVEYILTESPIQALIWENDLVRKEQPRYNTKLRDDKHYPYVRIDVQNPWPVARVSRRIEKDGARYFGPFPHATSVRQTLDTLSRLFPQILCNRVITGNDPRACLYYHIKRCPAPCIGAIDNAGYRDLVDGMVRFLDGKNSTVLSDLEREMESAAENLEFERAADLRDRLKAARKVIEQEKVGYTTLVDQDVVGFARDDGNACIQLFFMRDGKLARRDAFLMQDAEGESDRQVLTSFVKQFYARVTDVPAELLLPDDLDEADDIAEWLRQVKGRRVELSVPRRGEKRRIVDLATKNARDALEQQKAEWLADNEKSGEAALQLQEALSLPRPPRRIECYDISHVQGTSQVASMVVFEDGKAKRSDYKRFRIKHQEGNNDFLSMQEVIRRRFTRALAATPGTERMGSGPDPDAFAALAEPGDTFVSDLAVEPYPHEETAALTPTPLVPLTPSPSPSRTRGPLASPFPASRGEGRPTHTTGDSVTLEGTDDRRFPLARGRERGPGGEGCFPSVEDDESSIVDAHLMDWGLQKASADTHGGEEAEQTPADGWGVFPDLVIVDGGKGQLSAAVEVMDSLELSEIPIVGLAKEREEIFQKHQSEPVVLQRNSQALYLVQRVRDEAHRFAITYHRKVRGKKSLRSQLDEVQGVGPARKKALLRQFGTMKAIRAASVDELATVPGMTRRAAEELKRALAE